LPCPAEIPDAKSLKFALLSFSRSHSDVDLQLRACIVGAGWLLQPQQIEEVRGPILL